MHFDVARDAEASRRGKSPNLQFFNAETQFKVFRLRQEGSIYKAVPSTRWVLTWRVVDGKKSVEACPVAKGYQDPDLKDGNVDTSGRVTLRSNHLQVILLGALDKGKIWRLDIKNARRTWEQNAPSYC